MAKRRNLYEMNYARLEKLLGRPPAELLGECSWMKANAENYRLGGLS